MVSESLLVDLVSLNMSGNCVLGLAHVYLGFLMSFSMAKVY